MTFARQYLSMQLQRGQKLGHIKVSDPAVTAEMLLRLTQSLMLSPQGVIDPASEKSLRQFVEGYLRPLLTP